MKWLHLSYVVGPPCQILVQTGHQWLRKLNGVKNQGADFGDFPIQIAENSRKRPYFDGSYLSNRVELEGK